MNEVVSHFFLFLKLFQLSHTNLRYANVMPPNTDLKKLNLGSTPSTLLQYNS